MIGQQAAMDPSLGWNTLLPGLLASNTSRHKPLNICLSWNKGGLYIPWQLLILACVLYLPASAPG